VLNTTDGLLPDDLSTIVESDLASDEQAVWVEQPIPWRFARTGLPIVLFGIPWTAFALFWMAGASGFKVPDFTKGFGLFPLFGIPFVLIGFGMLSSPYWMYRKALRTVYVITDQRVILFSHGLWGGVSIRSFEPSRLTDLRRVQLADGSGNLIFGREYSTGRQGQSQSIEIGFLAVRNVKDVEARIRDLIRHAKHGDG
jgi:hypothetical protein